MPEKLQQNDVFRANSRIAGMLNTRSWQFKYDPSVDILYPKCGGPEAVKHGVFEEDLLRIVCNRF